MPLTLILSPEGRGQGEGELAFLSCDCILATASIRSFILFLLIKEPTVPIKISSSPTPHFFLISDAVIIGIVFWSMPLYTTSHIDALIPCSTKLSLTSSDTHIILLSHWLTALTSKGLRHVSILLC